MAATIGRSANRPGSCRPKKSGRGSLNKSSMTVQLFNSLTLALLLVAAPQWSRAQDEAARDARRLAAPQVTPPPALSTNANWIVLARETGGIAGVDHEAAIDSTGAVRCAGFRHGCPDEISADALVGLNSAIREASPFKWSESRAEGSDLLSRSVVLVVRFEATDATAAYTASWNLAPPEGSEDAGRLHDLIRQLAFP